MSNKITNIEKKSRRTNGAKIAGIIFAAIFFSVTLIIATPSFMTTINDAQAEDAVAEILATADTASAGNVSNNSGSKTLEQKVVTEAKKTNSDTVGWIKINNTNINYPVMQGKDNSYYLNHNFNGKKSVFGAIFADCRFNTEALGRTTVLYGHSVTGNKKTNTMFTDLKKFEDINFVSKNPFISFSTKTEEKNWVVIGCFWTTAKAEEDNGYIMNYIYDNMSANDMRGFITEMEKRSFYTSDVSSIDTENDRFLILSTCTRGLDKYENGKRVYKAEGRLVVVAKEVSDTDISVSYTANNQQKMPQIYYTNRGIENPFEKDTRWYPTKTVA